MTDKLPLISRTRVINSSASTSTSLIGRGLNTILNKDNGLARSELDDRYRRARDIYDRITIYSNLHCTTWQIDKQKELSTSFEIFKLLADMDYGKTYFLLARIYRGYHGVNGNHKLMQQYGDMAFNWLFDNQLINDSEIWNDLGTSYRCGIGVERDNSLAFFWYTKAAEKGHIGGQYFLGSSYSNWYWFNQDQVKAAFWFRKSAEQNFHRSQYELAKMYADGRGLDQDDEQAVFWYRKAAEQGYVKAQEILTKRGINWMNS